VVNPIRQVIGWLLMLPFALLLVLFLIDASSFEYVWLHGGSDLPLAYRISALWAGRAGPLLLWVAMLGALLLIDGQKHASESADQHTLRIRLLIGFSSLLLFIGLMLDPFKATPAGMSEGMRPGLNALLQTDLMVIHPPLVFAFYTLCIGVGLHAVTAMLISGAPAKDRILHLARPALFVGTLGVGLGGLWAYTVLDWGGYWAWDPVETGSLMPWLALILLLHLRLPKGMSNKDHWFIGLGTLPAFFSVHATLITRANGVWASVHAFVANKANAQDQGPIQRILEIGVGSSEGLEVHLYLLILVAIMWLTIRHLAGTDREWAPVSMLAGVVLGLQFGTLEVGLLAGVFAFLMWSQRHSNERGIWMAAGVVLMLFSAWAFLLPRAEAFVGMVLFLLPWMIEKDAEDAVFDWADGRWQQRVVLWAPLAIGAPYLLLTWLLLLAEVDGTSLAWHEMFGLPLICLAAFAMSVYAWRKVIEPRHVPTLIIGLILVGLLFGAIFGNHLPGDADHLFTDSITRGMVAGFALPMLVFAMPPIARLVWVRGGEFNLRRKPLQLRRMAMHIAHLGILLLLVGHVFTTTLVERGDPSHVVMLPRDAPIQHNGYWYTFTDLTATEDVEIGDGLISVTIEIREESDGPVIATLTPGMTRFDAGSISARSETDTWIRPQGDLVIIFDQSQSNVLGLTSFMQSGEDVDRIRVTIYDLTGSHMVWAGWILTMIGTSLNWLMVPSISRDEEE